MYDLTAFQRDLMFVIAGKDEPHGLALKEELEQYYEVEIHHGRLYPNLDTIVDKGLVSKGTRDKRTNTYEITNRGRREIESHREWIDARVSGEEDGEAEDEVETEAEDEVEMEAEDEESVEEDPEVAVN